MILGLGDSIDMKAVAAAALVFVSVSVGEILSDLRGIGVPAHSAFMEDGLLIVEMSGSLAEGDSLLKHYGGVFYTAVDSILGGWGTCGLLVRLEEASLLFERNDMYRLFDWISEDTDEEAIAEWVLNHTRVIREESSL